MIVLCALSLSLSFVLLGKYALPGINVPESVMRYPKELSDEEFEATNKRIEPKEEKDSKKEACKF